MTDRGRTLDVRERDGGWGRAQSLKNDVLYAAIHASLAVCRVLPARALRGVGRAVGLLAHTILPGARRIALANVERAMPALDAAARRALVRRVFAHLGEHLGDAVLLLRDDAELPPLALAAADRETLAEAIAAGRGVVFVSAHLGAWERLGATLVAAGVPLTTVARAAYDPRLDALYERLRGGRGVLTIIRGRPGAAARMTGVLARGGVLGVLMDLRSRVPSIEAPFLGHPAATAVGPARLALRTGAAVVVGVCGPGDTVRFARIPTDDLTDHPDREHLLTARLNEALSGFILAHPEGWVWMHDRFAHR